MLTDSGFIKVCSVNSPGGSKAVGFSGQDVIDQTLSADLNQRNINTKAECQSNGLNIRVRFRFDLDTNGDTIAVDVQRF
jgi:hypothetical protein